MVFGEVFFSFQPSGVFPVRVSNKDTTISLESELELFRKIEINASSMASALNNSSMAHTNETKPRLRKDEVEILEREFKKNPKPTTQTRRDFAEDIGVDLARITNWFQNRRAKQKQDKKQQAYEAIQAQKFQDSRELAGSSLNCNKPSSESLITPNDPPLPTYNPVYDQPSVKSMESLTRTLSAAQAASFTGSFAKQKESLMTPVFGRSIMQRHSIGEVPQLQPRIVGFEGGSRKPEDDDFCLKQHTPAFGGDPKSYPRQLYNGCVVARQPSAANMGFFTDARSFMEQNYPQIQFPPSSTAGPSLDSSLRPLTPTSPVETLVSKIGDSDNQHRIPIRSLPFIPEEPGKEPNANASDAVDEVLIKIERGFKSEEVERDEVVAGGVRSWLDQINHTTEIRASESTSNPEEAWDNVTLSILSSRRSSLIDGIMDKFWSKFDQSWEAQATQRAGNSLSSSGEGSARGTPEASVSSTSQSTLPSKRQRFDDEQPDESGNKKRRQPNVGSSKGPQSQVKFACPFRKHDPQKYNMYNHRVCALKHWDTIARVKEHLYRNHRMAPFCKRCWRVFETEELLDTHGIVPATAICEVSKGQPPDGVTPKQVAALRSKARPYSSQKEEDRWKSIFSLLFPGEIVPSPYWEPVQEQGRRSPGPEFLARYDDYMIRELPSLVRQRIEDIVHDEMQPVEASLLANLNLEGLIRDCQDQLSRAYRAADEREECLEVAQLGHRCAVLAKEFTADPLPTIATQQPVQSPPDFVFPSGPLPPAQDNFRLDFSTLDEEVFGSQTQKQTSDTGSGSDSAYASARLCNCTGSCTCLGWLMVSTTEDVIHSDSLAAGAMQSEQDDPEVQGIQWQSWMEDREWGFDP